MLLGDGVSMFPRVFAVCEETVSLITCRWGWLDLDAVRSIL